jgi:hypothetical protein
MIEAALKMKEADTYLPNNRRDTPFASRAFANKIRNSRQLIPLPFHEGFSQNAVVLRGTAKAMRSASRSRRSAACPGLGRSDHGNS